MSQYFEKFKNTMTREAAKADNLAGQPRYGLIESYNPDTNMVVCSLLPEMTTDGDKILTNWLQLVSPWGGPAWGDVAPLEIGDQVIMVPMNNSGSEFVVIGMVFNDVDTPAEGPDDIDADDSEVQIGERLLRSKTGTTVKFVDPNTLMIKADYHKEQVLHIITKGTDVTITCSDNVTVNSPQTIINGHLQVNGSINATGNITDYGESMADMRHTYNPHTHDDSDGPDQEMAG